MLRTAAAVLVVAGLGWLSYAIYLAQMDERAQGVSRPAPSLPVETPPAAEPGPPPAGPPGPPEVPPGTDPQPALPVVQVPPPASPPPQGPPRPDPTPVAPPATSPAQAPPRLEPAPVAPPVAPAPAPAQVPDLEPQLPAIPEVAPLPLPAPRRPALGTRLPAPLKDPLPRIESILIDHNRRLAIVNGRIVGVGDPVGPRVVVQIEAEAVVLREPSGLDVRVPLRSGRQNTGL